MRSIGEDGLKKAMAGTTTLEEGTRGVYLAEQTAKLCGGCPSGGAPEFDYCPTGGPFVGQHREACRPRLPAEWTFCPLCGTDAARAPAVGDEVEDRASRRARLDLPQIRRKAS